MRQGLPGTNRSVRISIQPGEIPGEAHQCYWGLNLGWHWLLEDHHICGGSHLLTPRGLITQALDTLKKTSKAVLFIHSRAAILTLTAELGMAASGMIAAAQCLLLCLAIANQAELLVNPITCFKYRASGCPMCCC